MPSITKKTNKNNNDNINRWLLLSTADRSRDTRPRRLIFGAAAARYIVAYIVAKLERLQDF